MAIKKAIVSVAKKRRVIKNVRKPALRSAAVTVFTGEELVAYLGAGESMLQEK